MPPHDGCRRTEDQHQVVANTCLRFATYRGLVASLPGTDTLKKSLIVGLAFALSGTMPAHALNRSFTPTLSERDLVTRYCKGMITEFVNPDLTRTDCISPTHAIEVEFSHKWAEAIGQALHYSLWTKEFSEFPDSFARHSRQVGTPRRAGIIFACGANRSLKICTDHIVRVSRIVEEFKIPLTIWFCDPNTDMTLAECQPLDFN